MKVWSSRSEKDNFQNVCEKLKPAWCTVIISILVFHYSSENEEDTTQQDDDNEEDEENDSQDSTVQSDTEEDVNDELNENPEEDVCVGCKTPGMLICCDCCPRAYHLHCAKPPLKKVRSNFKDDRIMW